MKILKNIGLLAMLMFAMVACVEKTPDYGNFPTKDVDFTYNVDGDEYTLDFYVVSKVQFNNTSAKSGAVSWDFGDGSVASTDANPVHKYAKAGLYNVKLTVDGVGTRTYPILIYDITPVLSVASQSAEIVTINDVTVDLSIELPNPENLICKYVWKFPEGTLKSDGTEIREFEGESHADGTIDNPGALKFRNIGSQKIELQTWFDVDGENRRLDDSYVNVQVGYNKEVPTIYYAVLGGNIKAYKIIPDTELPEGTKNMPFDLGVNAGSMPLQLVNATVTTTEEDGTKVEDDYIYIMDAGKQYTYINDESSTNGDGKVSVISADGTYANVVVTNVGQQAFNDPFQGCTDGTYLYYTDRNTGIRQIELTKRGEKESTNYTSNDNYFVTNSTLGYYGNYGNGGSIAYGAGNTDIIVDSNGMFYWAKGFNGAGIYRFKKADIGVLTKLPYQQILSNTNPKALAIDETRKKLYVWQRKATPVIGFCQYDLPAADATIAAGDALVKIAMDADPINTSADEGIYTSQFAVDSATGNVYFGFRATTTETAYTTGLYYFDYTTSKMVNFAGNKEKILGVAINPRKTKLF